MRFKDVGWAMFCEEATEYSDAFQTQMSQQLYAKFCANVQEVDTREHRKFFLHVGMTAMQTIVEDGYAFTCVDVISPDSLSTTVTAYWKTKKIENLLTAVNDVKLTDKDIEFGWCSDFDKSRFLNYRNRRKELVAKNHELRLDTQYNFDLYPDLSVLIQIKNTDEADLIKRTEEIFRNSLLGVYVSNFSFDGNDIVGNFDFGGIEYEKGSLLLKAAVESLSISEISSQIKKILIE